MASPLHLHNPCLLVTLSSSSNSPFERNRTTTTRGKRKKKTTESGDYIVKAMSSQAEKASSHPSNDEVTLERTLENHLKVNNSEEDAALFEDDAPVDGPLFPSSIHVPSSSLPLAAAAPSLQSSLSQRTFKEHSSMAPLTPIPPPSFSHASPPLLSSSAAAAAATATSHPSTLTSVHHPTPSPSSSSPSTIRMSIVSATYSMSRNTRINNHHHDDRTHTIGKASSSHPQHDAANSNATSHSVVSLGDPTFSPLFNRRAESFPIIHVFGHTMAASSSSSAGGGEGGGGARDGRDKDDDDDAEEKETAGDDQQIRVAMASNNNHHHQRQSCCMHIHGVLPYLYVPRYDGRRTAVGEFALQLELAMIKAFHLGGGGPRGGRGRGGDAHHHHRSDNSSIQNGNSNEFSHHTAPRVIHYVAAVLGTPFYGYYERPREFLKIYFYDPSHVSKAANLLGSTRRVMGRRWQPYQGHVPFVFQWMLDCGLSGMGAIEVKGGVIRDGSVLPMEWQSEDQEYEDEESDAAAAEEEDRVDVKREDTTTATDGNCDAEKEERRAEGKRAGTIQDGNNYRTETQDEVGAGGAYPILFESDGKKRTKTGGGRVGSERAEDERERRSVRGCSSRIPPNFRYAYGSCSEVPMQSPCELEIDVNAEDIIVANHGSGGGGKTIDHTDDAMPTSTPPAAHSLLNPDASAHRDDLHGGEGSAAANNLDGNGTAATISNNLGIVYSQLLHYLVSERSKAKGEAEALLEDATRDHYAYARRWVPPTSNGNTPPIHNANNATNKKDAKEDEGGCGNVEFVQSQDRMVPFMKALLIAILNGRNKNTTVTDHASSSRGGMGNDQRVGGDAAAAMSNYQRVGGDAAAAMSNYRQHADNKARQVHPPLPSSTPLHPDAPAGLTPQLTVVDGPSFSSSPTALMALLADSETDTMHAHCTAEDDGINGIKRQASSHPPLPLLPRRLHATASMQTLIRHERMYEEAQRRRREAVMLLRTRRVDRTRGENGNGRRSEGGEANDDEPTTAERRPLPSPSQLACPTAEMLDWLLAEGASEKREKDEADGDVDADHGDADGIDEAGGDDNTNNGEDVYVYVDDASSDDEEVGAQWEEEDNTNTNADEGNNHGGDDDALSSASDNDDKEEGLSTPAPSSSSSDDDDDGEEAAQAAAYEALLSSVAAAALTLPNDDSPTLLFPPPRASSASLISMTAAAAAAAATAATPAPTATTPTTTAAAIESIVEKALTQHFTLLATQQQQKKQPTQGLLLSSSHNDGDARATRRSQRDAKGEHKSQRFVPLTHADSTESDDESDYDSGDGDGDGDDGDFSDASDGGEKGTHADNADAGDGRDKERDAEAREGTLNTDEEEEERQDAEEEETEANNKVGEYHAAYAQDDDDDDHQHRIEDGDGEGDRREVVEGDGEELDLFSESYPFTDENEDTDANTANHSGHLPSASSSSSPFLSRNVLPSTKARAVRYADDEDDLFEPTAAAASASAASFATSVTATATPSNAFDAVPPFSPAEGAMSPQSRDSHPHSLPPSSDGGEQTTITHDAKSTHGAKVKKRVAFDDDNSVSTNILVGVVKAVPLRPQPRPGGIGPPATKEKQIKSAVTNPNSVPLPPPCCVVASSSSSLSSSSSASSLPPSAAHTSRLNPIVLTTQCEPSLVGVGGVGEQLVMKAKGRRIQMFFDDNNTKGGGEKDERKVFPLPPPEAMVGHPFRPRDQHHHDGAAQTEGRQLTSASLQARFTEVIDRLNHQKSANVTTAVVLPNVSSSLPSPSFSVSLVPNFPMPRRLGADTTGSNTARLDVGGRVGVVAAPHCSLPVGKGKPKQPSSLSCPQRGGSHRWEEGARRGDAMVTLSMVLGPRRKGGGTSRRKTYWSAEEEGEGRVLMPSVNNNALTPREQHHRITADLSLPFQLTCVTVRRGGGGQSRGKGKGSGGAGQYASIALSSSSHGFKVSSQVKRNALSRLKQLAVKKRREHLNDTRHTHTTANPSASSASSTSAALSSSHVTAGPASFSSSPSLTAAIRLLEGQLAREAERSRSRIAYLKVLAIEVIADPLHSYFEAVEEKNHRVKKEKREGKQQTGVSANQPTSSPPPPTHLTPHPSFAPCLAIGLAVTETINNKLIDYQVMYVDLGGRGGGGGGDGERMAGEGAGTDEANKLPTTAIPPTSTTEQHRNATAYPTEAALLIAALETIRSIDPDVILSWDTIRYGLGYVLQRALLVCGVNGAQFLSRLQSGHQHTAASSTSLFRRGGGGAQTTAATPTTPAATMDANQQRQQLDRSGVAGLSSPSSASFSLTASGDESFEVDADGILGGVGGGGISQEGTQRQSLQEEHVEKGEEGCDIDDDDDDNVNTSLLSTGHHGASMVAPSCSSISTNAAAAQSTATPAAAPMHHSLATATATTPATSGAVGGGRGGRAAALAASTSSKIVGRIVLPLHLIATAELKQKSYTLQAVYQSLLNRPFPCVRQGDMALGMRGGSSDEGDGHEEFPNFASPLLRQHRRAQSLSLLEAHTIAVLSIAKEMDVCVRASEMAQMYGILFYETVSRGSQFRVESFLQRVARPFGYLMPSPSKEQVMRQNRQEAIPLVMEPFSGLYTDPVVVLDFRSLYPSIVIAYNLCYSTLLGKVSQQRHVKLGAVQNYRVNDHLLKSLLEEDAITFAPNSAMFVKPCKRRGILPIMLSSILNMRFQVQSVMKSAAAAGDDDYRRVLDARQLALKLLANVTYGYTAATFTGRMPCSDVADSIVLLGRQTLERAIRIIESGGVTHNGHNTNTNTTADSKTNTSSATPPPPSPPLFKPWSGARVIYGDTDSLFIQLPRGTSRDDAFDIASNMCTAINSVNPSPVTIKFEKVYQPCFMVTKKRYVGYAYESKAQKVPKFDAKGIETIRRDQCDATSKVMEEMIRLLFDEVVPQGNQQPSTSASSSSTAATSAAPNTSKSSSGKKAVITARLKRYFYEQANKIQRGDMHPRDLILRREVKLGAYASESSIPPAARVALRRAAKDPASAPAYKERVPFIVLAPRGNTQLKDMVEDPLALVGSSSGGGSLYVFLSSSPQVPTPTPYRLLNAHYYLTKHIIPSLDRLFAMVGVSFAAWFKAMPRSKERNEMALLEHHSYFNNGGSSSLSSSSSTLWSSHQQQRQTIDQYFAKTECVICHNQEREEDVNVKRKREAQPRSATETFSSSATTRIGCRGSLSNGGKGAPEFSNNNNAANNDTKDDVRAIADDSNPFMRHALEKEMEARRERERLERQRLRRAANNSNQSNHHHSVHHDDVRHNDNNNDCSHVSSKTLSWADQMAVGSALGGGRKGERGEDDAFKHASTLPPVINIAMTIADADDATHEGVQHATTVATATTASANENARNSRGSAVSKNNDSGKRPTTRTLTGMPPPEAPKKQNKNGATRVVVVDEEEEQGEGEDSTHLPLLKRTFPPICCHCVSPPSHRQSSLASLAAKRRAMERHLTTLLEQCQQCMGCFSGHKETLAETRLARLEKKAEEEGGAGQQEQKQHQPNAVPKATILPSPFSLPDIEDSGMMLCYSIDCPITFDKQRVRTMLRHVGMLERFVASDACVRDLLLVGTARGSIREADAAEGLRMLSSSAPYPSSGLPLKNAPSHRGDASGARVKKEEVAMAGDSLPSNRGGVKHEDDDDVSILSQNQTPPRPFLQPRQQKQGTPVSAAHHVHNKDVQMEEEVVSPSKRPRSVESSSLPSSLVAQSMRAAAVGVPKNAASPTHATKTKKKSSASAVADTLQPYHVPNPFKADRLTFVKAKRGGGSSGRGGGGVASLAAGAAVPPASLSRPPAAHCDAVGSGRGRGGHGGGSRSRGVVDLEASSPSEVEDTVVISQ